MKTIYAVCFLKHNENHEIAYHYFEKIEKAQKYLEETSKKYKNDLVMWNKNESGLWSFKISLETFYIMKHIRINMTDGLLMKSRLNKIIRTGFFIQSFFFSNINLFNKNYTLKKIKKIQI